MVGCGNEEFLFGVIVTGTNLYEYFLVKYIVGIFC